MAKKTKDLESQETEKIETSKKAVRAKKASTKKSTTATSKASTKKKAATKKSATTKKATVKKETTVTKKVAPKKESDTKKSSTTEKDTTVKKTTPKSKASSVTKATTKGRARATTKTTAKKSTVSRKKKVVERVFKSEYYDLPYMYNKTVVKVLAQTPKMLFIYWEISEEDRNNLINLYGENFFNTTMPVLIVYNDTMHYSFEVPINDFANSWYLHIKDANCDYHVELGRRPYPNSNSNQPVYIPYYVYITSSNEMTSPNNRIMYDFSMSTIKFRNVKTGQTIEKDIKQFTFFTNYGLFTLQELYKFLYPNESFEYENIVVGNTSSGALSSSGMFSSQFK